AKMRWDGPSLAALMTGIGEFTESLPAALCWAAAWDMCRDAELAARDYVRLVLAGVGSVTDISVVQTLLRQASAALRRYADPAWRPAGAELAAGALRERLERAEPGSDAQLAYVQAFTGMATSPGDLALLAGLLDGSAPIDGLTVDTELRWRLLRRLISRGAAGEAEIEAELARDATDAGARRAAARPAAIPTAAAAEAAGQELVGGTLPNAMFGAVLDGFAEPDQAELLEPYQRRYFEVVGGIWRDWGSDMAQWFVANAYPVADSPAVVEATDDLIARTGPPAALRRLLIERRGGLQPAPPFPQRDPP